MSTHSKAAAKFIADAERTAWHDKALYAVREKRDKMARTVPEWEDLRRMSSEIKRHTLSHLGHYLEEFERNATANGMVVHWAADADEMNATVWRLVQEHGGRNLIKSKSMLSEECGLTPYLRERGVDAVHFSARSVRPGGMVFRNPHVSMGDCGDVSEYDLLCADERLIRQILTLLEP